MVQKSRVDDRVAVSLQCELKQEKCMCVIIPVPNQQNFKLKTTFLDSVNNQHPQIKSTDPQKQRRFKPSLMFE